MSGINIKGSEFKVQSAGFRVLNNRSGRVACPRSSLATARYADRERGQAGDLAMAQAQGGAKPLGKGLVNHPVFSSKWVMRAKE